MADHPIVEEGDATHRPSIVMLALGFGVLVTHGFGLSLFPALLPFAADEFGVGYGVMGGAVAAGLVAYSIGALSSGRLLEATRPRRLLVASFALSGVGLLVVGVAPGPLVATIGVVVAAVAAPVSWTTSLHVAGVTTAVAARSMVMSGASAGAAAGVVINGLLVQTSDSAHSWRVAFFIAAGAGAVAMVIGGVTFAPDMESPRSTMRGGAGVRRVLGTRAGRVAVVAALVAGVGGFPLNAFLSATAIDEMGVSSLGAAGLWWIVGGVGLLAGPALGWVGDRSEPLRALTIGSVVFAITTIVLAVVWDVWALALVAVGYASVNYPVWGLVGALADQHFERAVAVRAVTLGLVAATLPGAIASSGAGAVIDATGSFRGPTIAIAVIVSSLAVWYVSIARRGGLGAVS